MSVIILTENYEGILYVGWLMAQEYTVIIRNGYLQTEDKVVDIGITNDKITKIDTEIDGDAPTEIDANNNLVAPGFVDSHAHMDKSFAICGCRHPKHNDQPYDPKVLTPFGEEYFDNISKEAITKHAIQNAKKAVENGTTHIRTHVTVDTTSGTKTTEAVIDARDSVRDLLDIQIVPFSEQGCLTDDGVEHYLRQSIELGADAVGGMDPLTNNNNIDDAVDIWFDIATEFDVEIDAHIHEPGSLGRYTLRRLAEKTIEHNHIGKTTASHAFGLAGTPLDELDQLTKIFQEAQMKFITCYPSTRPDMPLKWLMEELTVGHGTDNIRDFIIPHGSADVLQGLFVQCLNMRNDPTADSYRFFEMNVGMNLLWEMATKESARVLSINDYGIYEGGKADLNIFDVESREWAIIKQPDPRYVLKNGSIVAKNGEMTVDVPT
ncbi:amidohydrolase family protein [Natrialbaceae archaeon A-CW1-1]